MKVAFDIGGTFTDVVIALADGRLATYKILSLPADLGENIAACIERTKAGTSNGKVAGIVHATTIASNTVLEANGATAGMIVTRGFRDDLEIRRFIRPNFTGYFWERRPVLIPRRRRIEVSERVGPQGEIISPLDDADVVRAVAVLQEQGVEAIAIALINSYANPVHERRIAEIIRKQLPGMRVAVSSEVLPEMGEYERGSTTALTAYLAPRINDYLDNLEGATKRYHPSLFIMQANGGVVPADHARRFPTGIIESGPAAGVLAASVVARRLKIEHAVSFDMGGTTVKTMLIENGQGRERPSMEVGGGSLEAGVGYALRFPAFDLVEIGAGGGSIAWIDPGGALRVGPKSAGAVPGPVCYGRGGTLPTVTDANVTLGYMSPVALAGGTVPIDRNAALRAFEKELCPALDSGPEQAAFGVHQVANVTMMRALRAVTTERGRDPRTCTLIAFGGAGPIHAAKLAEDLEIARVVIPLYPGLFSALGLLLADLRFDYVQGVPGNLIEMKTDALVAAFEGLEARAKGELATLGVDPSAATWHRTLDLQYQGQFTQLTVPLPELSGGDLPRRIARAFHDEHKRVYAYEHGDEAVVVLSARIRATASGGNLNLKEMGEAFLREASVPSGEGVRKEGIRDVHFAAQGKPVPTRILSRPSLVKADVSGPAILEEFDTTVVVPPKWRAALDEYANVILQPE